MRKLIFIILLALGYSQDYHLIIDNNYNSNGWGANDSIVVNLYPWGLTNQEILEEGIGSNGLEITPNVLTLGMDVLAKVEAWDWDHDNSPVFLEFTVTGDMELTISGSTTSEYAEVNPITITGCTDTEASNFYPYAREDDGSCVYDENTYSFMVDNNYTAGGGPAPVDVKLFRWGFTDELFLDLYPGNSNYISENGAEIHSDVLINGQEVMARIPYLNGKT